MRKSERDLIALYINDFLMSYANSGSSRFHMPGHKGVSPCNFNINQIDITEITGADNLLSPSGIIQRSQERAAEVFGAERTWFSTCGSSACILAMLLSLPLGSRVLIGRDCHKSVISGAILSGINATLVPLRNAQDVRKGIDSFPDASAVMITRPDYFGRCIDIAAISEECGERLLLVDEAHGAHYAFSKSLPLSCAGYADMWCNSAHKTLNALTPGAYLHRGKRRKPNMPDDSKLSRALSLVHTTSPSYPVMASLETAFEFPGDWDSHCKTAITLRERIRALGFDLVENDDITRIVVAMPDIGGYRALAYLSSKGVEAEMADSQSVAFITTPADPPQWYGSLTNSLASMRNSWYLDMQVSSQPSEADIWEALCALPHVSVSGVREAALSDCEAVPLSRAKGRVAAQSAGIYPPGVAFIAPGELISEDTVNYLLDAQSRGASLFGVPLLCVKA